MLNIRETYATQGKISNNLEMHGDLEVKVFDMRMEGIVFTGEEVNAFIEDPYADRWIFNSQKEIREPNLEGGKIHFEPLRVVQQFEKAVVIMTMQSGATHTFHDCRIKNVELEPKRGGETLVSFDLRVKPENDQQLLDLLEHQHHQIKIDVQEAKVVLKGGRAQSELPLSRAEGDQQPAPEGDSSEGSTPHPSTLFEEPKNGTKKRGRKSAAQSTH